MLLTHQLTLGKGELMAVFPILSGSTVKTIEINSPGVGQAPHEVSGDFMIAF